MVNQFMISHNKKNTNIINKNHTMNFDYQNLIKKFFYVTRRKLFKKTYEEIIHVFNELYYIVKSTIFLHFSTDGKQTLI